MYQQLIKFIVFHEARKKWYAVHIHIIPNGVQLFSCGILGMNEHAIQMHVSITK